MTAAIALGDITIHPVIEQQSADCDVMVFFPTLTKELLDENRSLLQPAVVDLADKLILCIQSFVIKRSKQHVQTSIDDSGS